MNKTRSRTLYPISSREGKFLWLKDGRKLLNLASNDYLGLSDSQVYRRALTSFAFPVGSGASRLLSGNETLMEEVEDSWARYRGFDRARFFPAGYQLNVSLIPALMSEADLVLMDRFVHASIVDGVRLSGARFKRFRHNDLEDLERWLKASRGKDVWIITETVFSMEGDFAPLKEIVSMARQWGAKVYVDEAHSVGVWDLEGVEEVDVLVGTFGKAIGLWGAYACFGRDWEGVILNSCRGFIFSTAPSPLLFYLVKTFLTEVLPNLKLDQYKERIKWFRRRLGEIVSQNTSQGSQIVPVILGSDERAIEFYRMALERGLFCPPIRPPTVPEGSSRARLSIRADVEKEELEPVLELVGEVLGR